MNVKSHFYEILMLITNSVLVDKITNLVDANERIFEAKQPNFFQRNQYNRNQTNQQGGGYNRQQNQQNWNQNKRQGQRGRKNVSFQHQQQQQQQQNEDKLE